MLEGVASNPKSPKKILEDLSKDYIQMSEYKLL